MINMCNDTKITNLVFIPNNSNNVLRRFKFRHSTGKIFAGRLLNVPYEEEEEEEEEEEDGWMFTINKSYYHSHYTIIVLINEKGLQIVHYNVGPERLDYIIPIPI